MPEEVKELEKKKCLRQVLAIVVERLSSSAISLTDTSVVLQDLILGLAMVTSNDMTRADDGMGIHIIKISVLVTLSHNKASVTAEKAAEPARD